jgi:ribonuclease P protein component
MTKGRYAKLPSLVIKTLPTKLGFARVAVVVPKKIHKSAVKRNTLKRQIINTLRVPLLDYPQSVDMVILLTRPDTSENYLKTIETWLRQSSSF